MSGSLTKGNIKLAMFNDMRVRYNAYVAKNKSLPNKIATISGGNSYILLKYFDIMVANKDAYVKYYKKEPASIEITLTKKTYGSSVTPVPSAPVFGLGYFINPEATPLNQCDFNAMKAKGITEVYIRILNSNYNKMDAWLTKIKAAGLKPYAWTWMGFNYTKQVTNLGWHMCHDEETYNMADYYSEIKTIQSICKASNKTFILCTKAQDWDGDQKWSVIKDMCDYIMPMLYLGDYNKTVTQLVAYMKLYNTKYPGKIYPALETYISDANVKAKSTSVLQAEINACKPYCKGLALFRYGIGGI